MTKKTILSIVRALGVCGIVAGGGILLSCIPYVVLNNWIIVGAAGIICVAGAILYAGGLLAVTHLIEK